MPAAMRLEHGLEIYILLYCRLWNLLSLLQGTAGGRGIAGKGGNTRQRLADQTGADVIKLTWVNFSHVGENIPLPIP